MRSETSALALFTLTLCFQINAAHTEQDTKEVLRILDQISRESG